ncbi:hypothetical protein [Variovorax boronicumulans]|uniref:hypothetical protein n=1 Tax=Variovorax boronicumulans TaxID=436515 RepID=UPI001C2087F9|nr:hypothetical protein [Variovorax boronicumulans]
MKKQIALHPDIDLRQFDLNVSPPDAAGTYEDKLTEAIRSSDYAKDLVLIVTDHDLSSKKWNGLSQAAVSSAARKLGLPVAGYRKKLPMPTDVIQRIPGNGLIELVKGDKGWGDEVARLARGFVDLEQRISMLAASMGSRPSQMRSMSPGALLASVLEVPEVAAHLDSLACGDQTVIAEILNFSPASRAKTPPKLNEEVKRRLKVAMGVWLVDLIMAYPGALINEVGTASYLDIHPEDFKRAEIKAVFEGARYKELPFASDSAPLWWRHNLDDILNEAGVTTGLDLCVAKGVKKVRYCPCSVDPKLHAGYLCLALNEPISAKNSSGRVHWFPVGADLARLTKSIYQKLGPWIGT